MTGQIPQAPDSPISESRIKRISRISRIFICTGRSLFGRYNTHRPGSVARVRALTVFNRWGQPVFHRSDFLPNDPKFGWDGRYGGTKLDAGVYAWLAEIEMADGAVEIMKGGVGLVR